MADWGRLDARESSRQCEVSAREISFKRDSGKNVYSVCLPRFHEYSRFVYLCSIFVYFWSLPGVSGEGILDHWDLRLVIADWSATFGSRGWF